MPHPLFFSLVGPLQAQLRPKEEVADRTGRAPPPEVAVANHTDQDQPGHDANAAKQINRQG